MFIIRFLLFIAAVIGVYVLSNIFTSMHDTIYVQYLQYQMEISSGFAAICLIVVCAVLSYVLRIIWAIISLPTTISEQLAKSQEKKTLRRILEAYADIITGKKRDAELIIKNVKKYFGNEYKDHVSLILSQSAENFDQTMHYLRELSEIPEYSYFAIKSLAMHYLYHGYNHQAFESLNQAIRLHNKDKELMRLMLKACTRLDLWPEFHSYVKKLQKIEPNFGEELSKEVAQYYLDGVSYYLMQEDDKKAIEYNRYALEFDPSSLDAIETYCWLCNNKGDVDSVRKVITQAFALRPSFELFFIYHSSVECTAEELYSCFTELVSPLDYPSVFVAIAAYLGLEKEVKSMRYIMDVHS